MAQFSTRIIMEGSGSQTIEVPSGYKYVAIINNTPDTVMLFKGQENYSDHDPKDAIVTVTPRTSITIPLGEYRTYFTAVFREGVVGDAPQVCQLIFAVENLNINTQLGTPGNTGNVVITGDAAGLAKQNQLPATLAPGGGLRAFVENQITSLGITSLPEVVLTPGQSVGVNTLPDIGIKPGQEVNVKNQITGFATSAKQDQIITTLGLIGTKANQENIKTLLTNLITLQTETNTKLQTLIDQGTTPAK